MADPMADLLAGSLNVDVGLGKATTDLPPPVEIMEVREDDDILRDGAGAVGHTRGKGLMADGFDLDSGLESPVPPALPPPATIPKLHYITAIVEWLLRGSGSLYSQGGVDNSVKLPGHQVIIKLRIMIMEEVMAPDWSRNFNCYLRKMGLEIISPSDSHGWVLKHDSVVVEVDEGIWIKAEKGGESWPLQNDGGIKLVVVRNSSHPEHWKDKGDAESGRYSVRFEADINLDDPSKITVKQLIRLLLASDVDYRVFSANCWQYGDSSVKNVLNFVLKKSEDEAVKVAVRKKLEELKLVERPMPRDVLLALRDPSAPENIKILEKLRRKLAGTLEGLPPNAKYRSWLCWSIKKFVDCIVPRNSLVIEDVADDGVSASSSLTARFRRWWFHLRMRASAIPLLQVGRRRRRRCFNRRKMFPPAAHQRQLPSMDVEPGHSPPPPWSPLLRQRKRKLSPNSSRTATIEGRIVNSVVAHSWA